MPAEWKNRTVFRCSNVSYLCFESKNCGGSITYHCHCIENHRITCANTAFCKIYLAFCFLAKREDQTCFISICSKRELRLFYFRSGMGLTKVAPQNFIHMMNCTFVDICWNISWLILVGPAASLATSHWQWRLFLYLHDEGSQQQGPYAFRLSICPSVAIQSILLQGKMFKSDINNHLDWRQTVVSALFSALW